MKIGSLFSGVGGLELGLERAGVGEVVWQVEIDPFCRSILGKHWPNATRYDDVRTVRDLERVDVICGGFPCQPVSVAGRRKAQEDARWLWPHFARIVAEVKPSFVVIENVPGLRTVGLRDVLADLASMGFDAEWACFGAFDVGAPHLRKRLFIVATHSERSGLRLQSGGLGGQIRAAQAPIPGDAFEGGVAANADGMRRLEQARSLAEKRGWARNCGWSLGPLTPVDDGVPRKLARMKRKAMGNAVVPQCAEIVGRYIVSMQ